METLFVVACGVGGTTATRSGSSTTGGADGGGGAGGGTGGGAGGLPSMRHACVVACGEQNPDGAHLFDLVSEECICWQCSPSCKQSRCYDNKVLSDECLPCVQHALTGEECGPIEGGLFAACWTPNSPCDKYVACLVACK